MLLSSIPQKILESYETQNNFRSSRRELVSCLTENPTDLVSKDWVDLLDIANFDNDIFRFYGGTVGGDLGVNVFPSYCKPFVEDSGATGDGFFELDLMFWNHAITKGYFSIPQGQGWSIFPIAGVASKFAEIRRHVSKFLTHDNHQDFRDRNLIVAVNTCNDWNIFRDLYHVGKWGTGLHKNSWRFDANTIAYRKVKQYEKMYRTIGTSSLNLKTLDPSKKFMKTVENTEDFYDLVQFYKNMLPRDLIQEGNFYYDEYNKYQSLNDEFLMFQILAVNV